MKLNINNIDMTLKEAKKILESEGFTLSGPGKPGVVSEYFAEYESPEICEAMQIACSAGFQLAMLAGVFDERKERLRKEYEKNTKAPGSGEEQSKEKKGIIYPTTFPKADFYHKHVLDEGNPALKESASQFNDALLDEQAKEIKRLKKKNAELLGIVGRMKQDVKEVDYNCNAACKENERLNEKIRELTKEKELIKKASLSQLEDFIEIYNLLTKESQKVKRLGKEIAKLNGIIHDKNAILSDVAEELRLTKIREKNLTEVGQKYMKENEELREKVAEKTKLVEMVRKGSKEYCEYGIAAEKMIQKMAKVIVGKGFICSEDFEKYCLWANGYRFNPQLPDFSEEEEKKLSLFRDDSVGAVTNQKDCSPVKDTHPAVDIAEEGADHSGVIVLCCKDFIDALKKVKDVWQE